MKLIVWLKTTSLNTCSSLHLQKDVAYQLEADVSKEEVKEAIKSMSSGGGWAPTRILQDKSEGAYPVAKKRLQAEKWKTLPRIQ